MVEVLRGRGAHRGRHRARDKDGGQAKIILAPMGGCAGGTGKTRKDPTDEERDPTDAAASEDERAVAPQIDTARGA